MANILLRNTLVQVNVKPGAAGLHPGFTRLYVPDSQELR